MRSHLVTADCYVQIGLPHRFTKGEDVQPSVLYPLRDRLDEVAILRTPGPPNWSFDRPDRCDRVRAAITNSGFSLPSGEVVSVTPCDAQHSPALDLPLALCVMLSDPAHAYLQRFGWIAWGALRLDGSLAPADADQRVVNDLPPGPCVGRIWDPVDRVPEPEDDAVISLVDVANLTQAWDVITFFVGAERMILGGGEVVDASAN